MDFLQQFSILFIVIVIIAFFVKFMRQPLIIGYVLAGLLFANLFSGDLSEVMLFFSEIGIMFLLFLMGMELDFKSLKYLGKDLLITTTLQSVIFFMIGLAITLPFHFTWMERVHFGIVLMFSSTLFAAKILEDRKETKTLHGKMVLATLIIQDVIAIFMITFLGVVEEGSIIRIVLAPLSGLALLVFAFITSKYLLGFFLKSASRFPELLFIFSLSIGFFFALVAGYIGYSMTIGTFIGGVVLGNTIYRTDIYGRMRPLVNFFNVIFFVGLGFQVKLALDLPYLLLIFAVLVFNFMIRPIVFYLTFRYRGYDRRTSFSSGIYLSQISEFGMIIVFGSIGAGLVGSSLSITVITIVILGMVLSTYMIKYEASMFQRVDSFLRLLDKIFNAAPKSIREERTEIEAEFVLFGYSEFGEEIANKIASAKKRVIVIESDPDSIEELKKKNIPYIFGSPYSSYFFEHATFKNPEVVISNLIDLSENHLIISELRKVHPNLKIIVTAKSVKDSLELYSAGADYVVYSSYINHQHVSALLQQFSGDIGNLLTKKTDDITRFQERRKEEMKKGNYFKDIDVFLAGVDNLIKEAHKTSKKIPGINRIKAKFEKGERRK